MFFLLLMSCVTLCRWLMFYQPFFVVWIRISNSSFLFCFFFVLIWFQNRYNAGINSNLSRIIFPIFWHFCTILFCVFHFSFVEPNRDSFFNRSLPVGFFSASLPPISTSLHHSVLFPLVLWFFYLQNTFPVLQFLLIYLFLTSPNSFITASFNLKLSFEKLKWNLILY